MIRLILRLLTLKRVTEEETPVAAAGSPYDTSFNFGFDFGPSEEISTIAPEECHGR